MKLKLFLAAVAAGVVISIPNIARADEGTVAVGGELIVQLRTGAGSQTLKGRADTVTMRLQDILALVELKSADIVGVPQKDGTVAIYVRKKLLLTATAEDGRPSKLTAKQQADVWIKHLRDVLPKVSIKPNPNVQNP
jgi:hypothetical protein